jgi:hypothetical protein
MSHFYKTDGRINTQPVMCFLHVHNGLQVVNRAQTLRKFASASSKIRFAVEYSDQNVTQQNCEGVVIFAEYTIT